MSHAPPRRLLLVAYFFPPEGGPGTQRPAKFCRYLPDFGWRPTVVSRARQAGERGAWEEDRSLGDDLPDGLEVIRAAPGPALPGWAAAVPDIDIARAWLGPAWEALKAAQARTPHDAALITMSPFDLAWLGPRIRAELGLPVVLDLRDPWALDAWRGRGRLAAARDRAAMRDALPRADRVIANTPEAREALVAAVPGLDPARVAVIPNGYDAADFAGPPPEPESAPAPDDDTLEILHIGTFYSAAALRERGLAGVLRRLKNHRPEPFDPSARTPLHLLRAVRLIDREDPALGARLRLRFIGRDEPATRQLIAEGGGDGRVEVLGYRPHGEALARLRAADALFLPLHGLAPGHRSRIVPAKTYEYLASGRPVLGCLPAGDARALVAAAPRGYVAEPADPASIARAIVRLDADRRAGRHRGSAPPPWIGEYERRALTGRLAALLDGLVSAGDARETAPAAR